MNKKIRYNIIGFSKDLQQYCLVVLGCFEKERMEKELEDILNHKSCRKIDYDKMEDFKIDEYEEEGNEWWNGNLD